MKFVITASRSLKSKFIDIHIDVNIQILEGVEVAASKIRPIYDEHGNIDRYALNEYENFIVNVYGLLDSKRFEEVEVQQSDHSKTSWYAWFYVKNKDGSINSNYIVRLRISDHINHARFSDKTSPEAARLKKYAEKSESQHLQDFANLHKQPCDKSSNQKYYATDIVINGDTFSDYLDAFEAVDYLIDRIYNKYSK